MNLLKHNFVGENEMSPFIIGGEKKNFILVAEIKSRLVKCIVEGPDEQCISPQQLENADAIMAQEVRRLSEQFPGDAHDVILTRASNIEDLKRGYPEFSGWEEVASVKIEVGINLKWK